MRQNLIKLRDSLYLSPSLPLCWSSILHGTQKYDILACFGLFFQGGMNRSHLKNRHRPQG